MNVLDFILSMKIKSLLNIIWFKWKDESVNLKSSFSRELFKTQVKRIFKILCQIPPSVSL